MLGNPAKNANYNRTSLHAMVRCSRYLHARNRFHQEGDIWQKFLRPQK